jgi:RNA polymerase sigma factor (sigma-70 family)
MPLHQSDSPRIRDYRGTIEKERPPAKDEIWIQLRRLAGSDPTIFWSLWEVYQNYLYGICLRHMGGVQEDAEDALSRVMMKVWELLPRHANSIHNLKAWLTRVAHNLCMDIHRERRQTRESKSLDELTAADDKELAHSVESPEEAVLSKEMSHYLYVVLNELSPKLRVPFMLHFHQEMPYRDIATQLAITPENARKRSQIARSILKDKLNTYLSGVGSLAKKCSCRDLNTCFKSIEILDQAAQPREEEIKSKTVAVQSVKIVLPSGIEKRFHIALDHKPSRFDTRIESLRKYVQQHPRGWKKCLELADLLCEAGGWEEAIAWYRQVLQKQPQLINVSLRLGEVLQLLEREAEAIAVYEKALPIVKHVAARHHLNGLIEICRGHYTRAADEFQQAAQLAPQQAAHWHSLGIAYLLAGTAAEALRAFDEALKLNPDDAWALTYSADTLRAMGRLSEAEQRLTKALALNRRTSTP